MAVSGTLLAVLALRNREAGRQATTFGLRLVGAAMLLVVLAGAADTFGWHVPVNWFAVCSVLLLGLPGLLLVFAVHVILL